MKLLFDKNLSFKLCRLLADIFPDSKQIRLIGMEEAADRAIWEYAKANGFILVSQDVDFADMATLVPSQTAPITTVKPPRLGTRLSPPV